MLSVDAITPDTALAETPVSERRLAANRANAQLSTGPRTAEGKAVSSLNAVKTGLTGHAVLLADTEQAAAYRAHVQRVFDRWEPVGDREHTLVQSLADTQWRLNSIPGLESALYALARQRGATLLSHPDPTIQRLLLDAQTEMAEAKALKNLRLQEGRLRRHYQKDEEELQALQKERWREERRQAAEEEQEGREAEAAQRRQARTQKRAARQQIRETAAQAPHGFEFSTEIETDLTRLAAHQGIGDLRQI